MPRHRRRTPPGAIPGSIAVHADAQPSRIDLIAYDAKRLEALESAVPEEIPVLLDAWPVVWINVTGLGSPDIIEALGRTLGLHSLALEDVVNVHQRPKVEDYDETVFIVARMPRGADAPATEQVSFFLGRNFVLTFQEADGDCFEPVRERLRHAKGRIRRYGPDYLAYALIDAIVDGFFAPVELYGDRLEALERETIERPNKSLVTRIHAARHDLSVMRKTFWSLREMLAVLSREPAGFFTDTTRIYLRDCYDHSIQLLDMTETYREFAASLFDLYLSTISNRMNEVMKVLTIIATIFIPLGVVAGIYGMNFNRDVSPLNMPELDWYWGYPFALGAMAAIALGMLFMFWRRRWF